MASSWHHPGPLGVGPSNLAPPWPASPVWLFFSFVLEPAPLCEDSPSRSCTDGGGAQHSQTTRPPLAHSSLSCLLCLLRACPEHHGAWEPDWAKLTRLAPHGTTVEGKVPEGAQLHLIFASAVVCDGVNVEAMAPSQHSTSVLGPVGACPLCCAVTVPLVLSLPLIHQRTLNSIRPANPMVVKLARLARWNERRSTEFVGVSIDDASGPQSLLALATEEQSYFLFRTLSNRDGISHGLDKSWAQREKNSTAPKIVSFSAPVLPIFSCRPPAMSPFLASFSSH